MFGETGTHTKGELVVVELVYRQVAKVASVKDEELRIAIETSESPYDRIAELEAQIERYKKICNDYRSFKCVCKFDENDNIIQLCGAHKHYFEQRKEG